MSERMPVAVLGAGGLIGQHFVRLLEGHPEFELRGVTGGERTVHRTVRDLWQISEAPPGEFADLRLASTSPGRLAREGVRLVFSGLRSGTAGPLELELHRRGVHVFSNASDLRARREGTLLIPEINGRSLRPRARRAGALLVTNPNCTATGLALSLAPIWALLRPTAVHVASYQALSGAGLPGVPSLAAADNVVPFIDGEEEKVAAETRRLLSESDGRSVPSRRVPIVAQCARVGVRDGHLEAVTVVAGARPPVEEITRKWASFDPLRSLSLASAPHPPVRVDPRSDRPQPVLDRWAGEGRARGMVAVVGRIRWGAPYLRYFVLSHNAVRGGAGGSVLNAEYASAIGRLGY